MSTPSFNSAFSTGGGGGTSNAISYGQAQSLTGAQKLQAARNSGTLVSLSYELAGPGTYPNVSGVVLPRFPTSFILHDVVLTTHEFFQSGMDWVAMHLTLTSSHNGPLVSWDSSLSEGVSLFYPSSNYISAGAQLTCDASFSSSGIYGSSASGLVLWIRGIWLD